MSPERHRDSGERAGASHDGARTPVGGTPLAVDLSRDLRARKVFVVFLGGPVVWFLHFMVVYAVVEAGCTGDGPGLRLFDPPVPTIVTLAATAVAAIATIGFAAWGYRRWRVLSQRHATNEMSGEGLADRRGSLSFAGFMMSLISLFAVLIVGLPALALPAC